MFSWWRIIRLFLAAGTFIVGFLLFTVGITLYDEIGGRYGGTAGILLGVSLCVLCVIFVQKVIYRSK